MNKELINLLTKDVAFWDNFDGKVAELPRKNFDQALVILKEQPHFTDMERRLKAHSAGEAVKHFCRDCRKPFWNVDDEDITCPFCGWKGFPVPDIDAEQIA